MTRRHAIRMALLIGTALLTLYACQRSEGPLKHISRTLDQAVERTYHVMQGVPERIGAKVEHAADNIQNSTRP